MGANVMYNVSQAYLDRLAQIESNGNPMAKNPNSSAKGLYQFIDSTAQQYGLQDPFDPVQATDAVKRLTMDNYNALKSALGREPSEGELYLAHQQGAGGALKLLKNPNAMASDIVGSQAANLNAGSGMTAQDFANQWINKFQDQMVPGQVEMTAQIPSQDAAFGMSTPSDLPEGFTLDAPQSDLPEGFVLDAEPMPVAKSEPITPSQQFAAEHPFARTLGRAGRATLTGLSSLVDTALLVPKTAALGIGLGLESLGAEKVGSALQNIGMIPSQADATRQIVDKATGDRLKPNNWIDKGGDFLSELITSSAPFASAPQAIQSVAKNGPTGGSAIRAAFQPENAVMETLAKGRPTPILPLPKVSEEGQRVAQLAKKYDIPLGMDDVSNSPFYKTMISEGKNIPFSGSAARSEGQMNKFTQAVAKSIGADTDKITPEVISNRFTELGKEFDNFFKGKKINLGEDFGLGLRQKDFIDSVSDNYAVEGKSVLDKYMGQINAAIQKDGIVDGEALGKVRTRVSKIARESKNPEISAAARDLENFIIDSVSEVSDKGAKEAFKNTKYQYKNLIAIEPLASKDQIGGQISPAQLLNRVRQVYGRAFSKGEAGELGDLANIGQYIKETIPNSGTAQRTGARNVLTGNLGVAPFVAMANPVAGAAQAGLSGLSMLANRGLQARNFNPALMDYATNEIQRQLPMIAPKSALLAIGSSANAGQQMLPKPQLQLTKQGVLK